MRHETKLVITLWGGMLGSMLLIGLIFQLPRLTQLPSSLTTGVEELFFLAIALILNRDWLRQTLKFGVSATWRRQIRPIMPTLIVAALIGLYTLATAQQLTNTLTLLFVAILISLFEETFFRGMLFQASQSTLGVGRAAVFTSILFSLTHLINLGHQTLSLTLLQLGFTFVLGLLWPLLIHTVNDFFSMMEPPINLPGITTTSFQIIEIAVIILLILPILRQNHQWLS
ncbi:CPBP family intramembrane glutamic endopeptidase [Lactiplantibacillus plantarum]|uniref:CPBP family intramembrane glutamic endopeptidase n=1 Tax=Lactiplantibacillus plantarum TaxID=1590 RepID=UPI001080EE9C|nr:CPBP family intramembrane glutamic endopeptidase [Lactiplantibacillus plantarum]QBX95776.1 CPBP family intramembrane metalloprotease [Lactiplantibacillus plantarum]